MQDCCTTTTTTLIATRLVRLLLLLPLMWRLLMELQPLLLPCLVRPPLRHGATIRLSDAGPTGQPRDIGRRSGCAGAMAAREKKLSAFSPVSGGACLAFRGGMSTRLVLLPYASAGADRYVRVASCDTVVRQMVFGTSKPPPSLLGHVRCTQELQHVWQLQAEGWRRGYRS